MNSKIKIISKIYFFILQQIKVDKMAISDKIDIDNETEQVRQQRALNSSKLISNDEIPKKERRGFCTNCSIF